MFRPSTGMDHLGLASASQDRILPALSPGVNVLTVHPRYWSVYLWLLTEFWDRELTRTNAAWGKFLKPRERIFVAAVLSCPRHGTQIPQVGGKDQIGKELTEGQQAISSSGPYLKNARGAYPIYASAISQLGLSVLDAEQKQFSCDAPSEAGLRIGEAVRDWISGTRYYKKYFAKTATAVPIDVLCEYAEKVCLCRLTDGPDHELLLDAFLHGGTQPEADARRASLRLVCDLSAQTVDEPVESWDFRLFTYYRSDGARDYTPGSDALHLTARRWRLYQHREFYAWGLNRWLRHIVDWGLSQGGDAVPIPLDEVLATVDSADFDSLADECEIKRPKLKQTAPFERLLEWVRSEGDISGDLDDAWSADESLSEDVLVDLLWRDGPVSGDAATAAILTLLAMSAARLWDPEYPLRYAEDWSLTREGGVRRLSVDRFLRQLRSQVRDGGTIASVGQWLLEEYIIRQHNRVALAKLPDDTFRLRVDTGAVWFFNQEVAVEFNDSRFRALSMCADELGLTRSLSAKKHSLTRRGRQLVNDGDLDVHALFDEDSGT